MTVSFLDAIKRGVGPSLEGLGWSEPCWAQRDVQLRRKTGDSSQIVLFARTRGLLHSGFYIHLYWRSNSIDERWDLDLNSIVPLPTFDGFWYFSNQQELGEWLEFLLPYLLKDGMAWLSAQPEPRELRAKRLEKAIHMNWDIMAYLGPEGEDGSSWKLSGRWEMMTVPWYKEYLEGKRRELPEVAPPWLRK